MPPLTVKELLEKRGTALKLEVLAGEKNLKREISVVELNRPGLALSGFFEQFRYDRIQVIGRGEHAFINELLKQSPERMKKFFEFDIPCIILTHRFKPNSELIKLANEAKTPLLLSHLETAPLVSDLSSYLEEKLSPTMTQHGVLVDTYGLGLLITGESGIGKSECALELIKRGHMLISDDVVRLQHHSGGILIGRPANQLLKHHIEVRGLGIIDVKQLFGVSAVFDFSRVELVVHLEHWEKHREYDRLGIEEQTVQFLDVPIPRIIIPVLPGRNLAVLIEVAALYHRVKIRGVNAAQSLEKKLLQTLAPSEG